MSCNIIIETRPTDEGQFVAEVAEGPWWVRAYRASNSERTEAYAELRETLIQRSRNPSGLAFIHAAL